MLPQCWPNIPTNLDSDAVHHYNAQALWHILTPQYKYRPIALHSFKRKTADLSQCHARKTMTEFDSALNSGEVAIAGVENAFKWGCNFCVWEESEYMFQCHRTWWLANASLSSTGVKWDNVLRTFVDKYRNVQGHITKRYYVFILQVATYEGLDGVTLCIGHIWLFLDPMHPICLRRVLIPSGPALDIETCHCCQC